ncbi:hypothetical protein B0T17DRAFT_546635 [Bombardia bombarda]|uniref:Uncharacterized protein n=1 Tax=Bombardia bombarda TaxID=252184 RepID=A0AA39TVL3_9PEZI|nr:hypothetical protein B0T17DRAFT_546635 [Bombardia bombarda]
MATISSPSPDPRHSEGRASTQPAGTSDRQSPRVLDFRLQPHTLLEMDWAEWTGHIPACPSSSFPPQAQGPASSRATPLLIGSLSPFGPFCAVGHPLLH